MKRWKIIAFSVVIVLNTACDSGIRREEVPSVVLNALENRFPDCINQDWELKGANYEVEFDFKQHDCEALLDKSGNLLRFKMDLNEDELPEKIVNAISGSFPGYRIAGVERIELNGEVYYKCEVKTRSDKQKLIFNNEGIREDHSVLH